MGSVVVRTLQTAIAAAIAVAAAAPWGDSDTAKLVAVFATAAAAIAIELLIRLAPRHLVRARRLLDARSVFEGVWFQHVTRVLGDPAIAASNRFAVFVVRYDRGADGYMLEGRAYDREGECHSKWRSADPVTFSRDGRKITYLWTGEIVSEAAGDQDPDRSGFSTVSLETEDGGDGRVDHVAQNVRIFYDVQRVTDAHVAPWRAGAKAAELADPNVRGEFAKDYARRL